MRGFYLGAALVTTAFVLWRFGYLVPKHGTREELHFGLFFIISSWCWILAFTGFVTKSLIYNTPFLKYANEAVLPFYILHQTVLLLIGHLVLQWRIPDPAKWFLIALSSFAIVMGVYEFGIRRFNALRILFGMKPMLASLAPETAPAR